MTLVNPIRRDTAYRVPGTVGGDSVHAGGAVATVASIHSRLKRAWRRFWNARNRDRDAGYIKAQIKDAERRHAPVEHLRAALTALVHDELRGAR